MKSATLIERKVKGRLAMMGYSQTDLAKYGNVSNQAVHGWLSSGRLTEKARGVLKKVLAVDDTWLDNPALADVAAGLDVLLVA